MDPESFPPELQKAIRFHGHLCPGLTIGYRASKIALERLGARRAEDEELIAIVENDSCSVWNAVQSVTGCTFGKGNFFFRDHGKQVFTFAVRPSGQAVRVAAEAALPPSAFARGGPDAAVEQMLHAPPEDLFTIEEYTIALPDRASVHESLICERCGEAVMATRSCQVGGRTFCIPCERCERKGAGP